jgi:hypothetical protein
MAGRRRKLGSAQAIVISERGRVQRRKPREGRKRAMNLVMLDENCNLLELLAKGERTTPAEIVQDFVEAACKGQDIALPVMPRKAPDAA